MQMQSFVDYCYRRFGKPEQNTNRPNSPSPFTENYPRLFDCCNLCCLNYTKDVRKWKHVKYGKNRYYFCSEDCWKEWLTNPSQFGAYSPPILPDDQIKEIESLDLRQMTIESKAGSD